MLKLRVVGPIGIEARYRQFDRWYNSALRKSNWIQMEEGQKTPAEKLALQIASLQTRCTRPGPISELNEVREEVVAAASHFLFDCFEVGAHWSNLESRIRTDVAMELSIRENES